MTDSVLLAACRREATSRTPVWFMRQAGRYMSAYREVRERHSMLDVCSTPELAAMVTMQPVQVLDVDAAILFSDLLLPLVPLGFDLEYAAGHGPVIHNPIWSPADVDRLQDVDVDEDLAYVGKAVAMVVDELNGRLPLLGFAGAPFTLASYLIEGGGSRRHERTKRFMYDHPDAWDAILSRLVRISGDLLALQVRHGAAAVQVFDSWVGQLSADDYREYVLPHSTALFSRLRPLDVPTVHFGVGTAGILPWMKQAGGDVIGVDWRVPIDQAWDRLGDDVAIQGNLDPVALFAPRDVLQRQVLEILERVEGRPGHIFNVGHGILPDTPVENVQYVIDLVRTFGEGRR